MEQRVILVDGKDRRIGTSEKIRAHSNGGIPHRAFSVFVFNRKGETLMQRRARDKYHMPGIWSNTCCSHQRPGERSASAAHRRLREEMGFDCKMKEVFTFKYEADVGNGLREREYDHVFFGSFNGEPSPDPKEVSEWKWMGLDELKIEIDRNAKHYTPWLRLMIKEVADAYTKFARRIS
jgi:isopentenyl-diphosphate delta-isomerase